jgi:predicted nucleic acid-binding protein
MAWSFSTRSSGRCRGRLVNRMADEVSHLFWDSCIFYAYLNDERVAYDVDSIAQYLQEARNGKHRIYSSTLVLAEVTPNAIKRLDIGSFHQFIDDLQGAVVLSDPTPNVMIAAARLRDLPYSKGNSRGRRLGTADAIMLASCLNIVEALGVKIDLFHTFDDGKKRGPEGKMVPLISYEDWCENFSPSQMTVAKPVIDLNRRRPVHPTPTLPGVDRP